MACLLGDERGVGQDDGGPDFPDRRRERGPVGLLAARSSPSRLALLIFRLGLCPEQLPDEQHLRHERLAARGRRSKDEAVPRGRLPQGRGLPVVEQRDGALVEVGPGDGLRDAPGEEISRQGAEVGRVREERRRGGGGGGRRRRRRKRSERRQRKRLARRER